MEIYYVIFICLIKNNELRIVKGHKVAFDILPQLKLAGFAIISKNSGFFASKMIIC
jgi:hypothetical protein